MSEIKVPTCGRIVHFFPAGNDKEYRFSGEAKLPAIVHTDDDIAPDLHVFSGSLAYPVFFVKTVPHKSVAPEGVSYWDWPEMK